MVFMGAPHVFSSENLRPFGLAPNQEILLCFSTGKVNANSIRAAVEKRESAAAILPTVGIGNRLFSAWQSIAEKIGWSECRTLCILG
jgi:hypothetical protein